MLRQIAFRIWFLGSTLSSTAGTIGCKVVERIKVLRLKKHALVNADAFASNLGNQYRLFASLIHIALSVGRELANWVDEATTKCTNCHTS